MKISLGRMLRRSLLHRRARSLSALIALTVSAAIATALLTLYTDLDAKLHHEFRSFGANIVITGDPLPDNALATAQKAAGDDALTVPFAFAVATTDRNTSVVVSGTDLAAVQRLDSWWKVSAWPTGADDALIGQKAANFIADEHALTLTFNSKPVTLRGSGSLETGGDEDSRIYMQLPAFTAWTGMKPSVIEVQVPGNAAKIESAIDHLRTALPGAKVEPVRQLVEGESQIVDRTHALMYAAVILIALTVGISVLATLSASVLERRRDFALMKALGGTHLQMLLLFLMEALVLALGGMVAGYILGSLAALGISELNFHTATLPHLSVAPLVLLLNLLIAAMAALLPARVLSRLEPAALLKGE
ncbi:MAG TPA: FtsX-like permease family protein [Granulicella sp.]